MTKWSRHRSVAATMRRAAVHLGLWTDAARDPSARPPDQRADEDDWADRLLEFSWGAGNQLRDLRSIEVSEAMIQRSCDRLSAYAGRRDCVGDIARDALRNTTLMAARLAAMGDPEVERTRVFKRSPYVHPFQGSAPTAEPARRKFLWSIALTLATSGVASLTLVISSFASSVEAADTWMLLAGLAMFFRAAVNLVTLQPPAFPQDHQGSQLETSVRLSWLYIGTLIAHGCDVMLWASLGIYFHGVGQPVFGVLALVSALLGVGGTFGRTAASTVGVKVPRRFFFERVARVLALTVALLAAAHFGNENTWTTWSLVVPVLTMGLYGVFEMIRSTIRVVRQTPTEVSVIVRNRSQSVAEHQLMVAPRPARDGARPRVGLKH